ncbi:hypothetical protein MRX96_008917 [Rhipicephalus microplus]
MHGDEPKASYVTHHANASKTVRNQAPTVRVTPHAGRFLNSVASRVAFRPVNRSPLDSTVRRRPTFEARASSPPSFLEMLLKQWRPKRRERRNVRSGYRLPLAEQPTGRCRQGRPEKWTTMARMEETGFCSGVARETHGSGYMAAVD